MNNKGFAITTVLYGTLILFCLLLVSMLGILATYKNNIDILINSSNGTRKIVEIQPNRSLNDESSIDLMGLYCISGVCKYYSGPNYR